MYDLVIKGGRVIDGAGNTWFAKDIGIIDGKIVTLGRIDSDAGQVIEADGKMVCPGFIDMHSHADLAVLGDRFNEPKIRQGVTTEIVGNCGLGVIPVNPEQRSSLHRYVKTVLGYPEIDWSWDNLDGYFETLEHEGLGTNVASYVPHGPLRLAVMGFAKRRPTQEELQKMKALLAEAMEAGAVGLSTGLTYPPGGYADTEELVELATVVAKYGGIYTSHMRSGTDRVKEALEETAEIGRRAGLPVHVSHFKVVGRESIGLESALELVDSLRDSGVDITYDVYPYTAGGGSLTAYLPLWAQEGGVEALIERLRDPIARNRIKDDFERGGWDNVVKFVGLDKVFVTNLQSAKNQKYIGKSIAEIAEIENKHIYDAYLDLLLEEEANVTQISFFITDEEIGRALQWPGSMVGSDGVYGGNTHPRLYGTFPRVLGKFVREDGYLSLEDAVRKMTGATATRLGLEGIGYIKQGMAADIVIFDPEKIRDRADFDSPRAYPDGISHVIVSGQPVIVNGEHTGARSGRVLRKV